MVSKKRETRKKKPGNKWNQLYFHPVESLNVIPDGERKRSGFHRYNDLASNICKIVFRTTFGLQIHTHEIHGEDLEKNRQKSSEMKALKRSRKDAEKLTSEDCYSEGDEFNKQWEEENLQVYRQACNQQKAHVKQIKDESSPIVEEINGGVFNGELLTDKDVLSRTGWLLNQSNASATVSQAEESAGPSNYRSSLKSMRGNWVSYCLVDVEKLNNWKDFEPLRNQMPWMIELQLCILTAPLQFSKLNRLRIRTFLLLRYFHW